VAFLQRADLPAPIPLRHGLRVLDVATGSGETAFELAGWFREAGLEPDIVAVDIDARRRAEFERKARALGMEDSVRLVVADAHDLAAIGRFDLAFCVAGISQILFCPPSSRFEARAPTAEAVLSVSVELLSSIGSALTPGGTLVVMDLDRDVPGEDHARGTALFEDNKWSLLPPRVIEQALRIAGFEAIRTTRRLLARHPNREETERSFAYIRPDPVRDRRTRFTSPWPREVVGPAGPHAFSTHIVQAQRGV
jgi:SAM-dependent methyltransferase